MAEMITRCPTCGTSFRITDAQLKTAKGAVRCGSCLQIFRALDNLVGGKPGAEAIPTPKPTPKPKPVKPAEPIKQPSEPLPRFEYKRPGAGASSAPTTKQPTPEAGPKWSIVNEPEPTKPKAVTKPSTTPDALQTKTGSGYKDDEGEQNMLTFDQHAIDTDDVNLDSDDDSELLISDDLPMDDDEAPSTKTAYGDDLAESFIDLDNWKPKEKSLFDRELKEPKYKDDDEDEERDADESWAIELLEESEHDEAVTFKAPASKPPAPSFDIDETLLDEDDEDEETEQDYTRVTTGSFSALDDSDIEEALGAPLAEHKEPEFHEDEVVDFNDDEIPDGFDQTYGGDFEQDYESDYDEDGLYADREDRGDMLRRIEPEPVEFGFHVRDINWRGKAVWGGLTTLGVLLLIIQVAWLQYDTLSRKQPYRGWYQLVGISVPSISDPALIRASNLVVRSHPDANNALMVDTILLNTARFTQPFPDLVLSFSDLQGKTLASRRFSPKEYLGGELAGRKDMPSNQPIHLSLEIVDPGPDAVNYTAYIPQD